jgi:RNA 3'-phosphate cyclase
VGEKLLEIDGSYGEGGGQILRNAVAFSTLTKKPVKITNIRANRPNPGIKAQHYVAIKSVKEITNADVKNLEIGSSALSFKPGVVRPGSYSFEVGTAGSVTLVFQACILACLQTIEPVSIRITGGTDVKWAPSWDYFVHVFLPLIKNIGVKVDAKLIKRGFYPKGGGEAEIIIHPVEKIKPLKLKDEYEFSDINGRISICNLPNHISTRMKHSVIKNLLKNNLMSSIDDEKSESLSPGVALTLWSKSDNIILGNSFLGERGVSSEEIGQNATNSLISEIESRSTLDVHAFDQLLPYMVLAKKNGSSSCVVREVTNHASTNMWLLKHFFDADFEAVQSENNIKIVVR